MNLPLVELYAVKITTEGLNLVGKATQERDHGDLFWLCQTFPPVKQEFQAVGYYKQEVKDWFECRFGEVGIIEGSMLSLTK